MTRRYSGHSAARVLASRRRGFTLIEALAAGLILAISGAVLSTTVVQAMRSLTLARDYQQAAELLDRTLTKIDMIGPGRLLAEGPTGGEFGPPHEGFRWQADIVSVIEDSFYDVTVRVIWQTSTGRRSTEAQTFLNARRGAGQTQLVWDDL